MKFASGTCFYNDARSLERTLQSLSDKMDYMVCIDGRYVGFEDKNASGLSVDGSREVVKSFDKAVLIDMPNSFEVQKRQRYLDWCDKDRPEFLLIIDSDEYIAEYDDTAFIAKCQQIVDYNLKYNVYAIMLEVHSGKYDHIVHEFVNSPAPQVTRADKRHYEHAPRLWFKPWEMEYWKLHYHYRKKNPTSTLHYQEQNAAVAIVPGMKLNHDHALRTKEHLEHRKGYQRKLVDFEQKKIPELKRKTGKEPLISEFDDIFNGIL